MPCTFHGDIIGYVEDPRPLIRERDQSKVSPAEETTQAAIKRTLTGLVVHTQPLTRYQL
jgi:hypothetical protein